MTSARDPQPSPAAPPLLPTLSFVFVTAFVLGIAVLIGTVIVTAGRDDRATASKGAAAAEPAMATLSDLKITPSVINATTAGGVHAMNTGAVQHNLAVEGASLTTPMIGPGGSSLLGLSALDAGDYTLYCTVPGHREAGMTATLHLSAGAEGGSGDAPTHDPGAGSMAMTPEQMDKAMKDSIGAFPAKTEGLGAQVLAPEVLADGTKQFELTTSVTQWEVSPGKKVDAMTYNGTVPGPTIKVNPGDRVRIILHNQLPESTSIHFHGLTTPNAMDGTTEVTQDPVKSGEDFTYEWTVQETPAVGMYHSHHNAVVQVPNGLAGAFLVGTVALPPGVHVSQEQVMVLDDSGTVSYALNGKSFPATAPYAAKRGEWLLLHYMNEGAQIHPMHLHGMPQLVVAKDGFALPAPQLEDTVTVAPGERYSVLVHATEPGVWVWHCHILPHAENDTGMFGMVTALIVQ
jgi:manganese oxidase